MKYESEKVKKSFNCKKCNKGSESWSTVKEHLNKHTSRKEIFKCSQCEKEFGEEWKMSAHLKSHKKYECDKCEKSFKYLDIKIKHVIVPVKHEKAKFYCHFFNNKKTYPYNDE